MANMTYRCYHKTCFNMNIVPQIPTCLHTATFCKNEVPRKFQMLFFLISATSFLQYFYLLSCSYSMHCLKKYFAYFLQNKMILNSKNQQSKTKEKRINHVLTLIMCGPNSDPGSSPTHPPPPPPRSPLNFIFLYIKFSF